MADLGAGLAVDVFSWEEALAFLAGRTGSPDATGARLVAGELGRLPLALAQAAAVIAAHHLDYPAYLRRLRDTPVEELLLRTGTDRYPHGLAAAVLLSPEAVRAGDGTGMCGAVMYLVRVLSPPGLPRALLHVAGQAGALGGSDQTGPVLAKVVDEALERLAGSSLLTFSTGGGTAPAAAQSSHTVILTMRLRLPRVLSPRTLSRKNRHIPCVSEHTGQPGLLLLLGGSAEPWLRTRTTASHL